MSDGVRSVWVDRSMYWLSAADREAWVTWLQRHGMPHQNDIPLGQYIECDDVLRQIRVDVFRKDEHGKFVVGVDDVLRDRVVVQLEAPALPLPGGYEVTYD